MPTDTRSTLEDLYNRITGDEDARVCKDIPDAACDEQPRNFFAYLGANLLGKVADEIGSAKLIIPWLFGALGVPATFTGFLVPIREAGVLVPQLVVAALIRRMAKRKGVWLLGSILSALSLFGMAWVAVSFEGAQAGAMIIIMLIVFSLSRGLCSVSAKDVLGKTISKSRRGALMGWSASLSGVAILAVGAFLGLVDLKGSGQAVFAGLLMGGGLLWLIAALFFSAIVEQPGSTEGGGNAVSVALKELGLVARDKTFRRYLWGRAWLLSVALAPPFYVLVAQQHSHSDLLGLGALVVANGLAAGISSPIWGYMGDRSSRWVMVTASVGAGLLGIFTYAAVSLDWNWVTGEYGFALLFLLLNVMHGGVRLGRKVYLVDMSKSGDRAAYVAVSNTLIGVLMLLAGSMGLVSDWLGPAATLLILAIVSLLGAVYIFTLKDVSEG